MGMKVIGAGLPRTGTTSLKLALEQLTGEPCYHMTEVFPRAETHLPLWQRVVDGEIELIDEILEGFGSTVDWPSSIFWREHAEHHPDALIVLTRRDDVDQWWGSASVAPDRLVELAPGDGWEPICAALGVEVPDDPYPHANTTAEFRANTGWE